MFQVHRKSFIMHLWLAFLFVAAICHGKPTNMRKDDPEQKDVALMEDSPCKGNLCPENTTKYKPRSCVDHLRNGANQCGYYKIYDAAGNGFTVYCDMETEPGAAWTLVVSWSHENKDFSSFRKTPLSVNDPVNENSPNWFLYRQTADRMKSLKAVSTHWRATCSLTNTVSTITKTMSVDSSQTLISSLISVQVFVLRPSL